jgi:peptidoglycan/xylan/chitin deacetylase (PgdA/CDA1 family)
MISVVIPAINEEKFLPECLESIRNQDYKGRYEIVVVDNGSTDSTVRIAKRFGARIVKYRKKGVTGARHAGASAAKGGIIVQADADTVYPEDWLTRISGQFSAHPEAVAVAGRYVYRDPLFWSRFEYFLRSFVNMLSMMFFKKPIFVSGANFAFRREAFLKAGGYRENSLSSDQYGICARLGILGDVIYDKELVAFTSSRRIQKPAIFIPVDVAMNVAKVYTHIFGFSMAVLQKSFAKIRNMTANANRIVKIIPPVVIIAFLVYGYFVPTSTVFGKLYYKGNHSTKVIALTFDDGPNEPYTSQVLDILDKYDVKATFFVVGKNVELYPDTVKRIVAEGDVLGDHSYTHNANHALTDDGCKETNLTQKIIFDVAGVEPHLYRPPHGKKSPWELECIKKEGLIEVTWDDSTNDQHYKSAESVAQKIISQAGPGEIILLHDGYGTEHNSTRSDRNITVEVLPLIIEGLQKQGYEFVTVPEILGVPAYNN